MIANERRDRLAVVTHTVAALGHEVIARELDVANAGAVTARERPDIALVGLGESSAHALGLIEKIADEAACPVVALIHSPDPSFLREASKRGVYAYITDADNEHWQSSIDIVLRRFGDYRDLEGAFGRRAVTERAKGILMERHSVDEAPLSKCCAAARAPPIASSSTSRALLSTAICCCPGCRRRFATQRPCDGGPKAPISRGLSDAIGRAHFCPDARNRPSAAMRALTSGAPSSVYSGLSPPITVGVLTNPVTHSPWLQEAEA